MFLYINLSLFFVKFLEIMNKNLRFLFNYKGGQMKNKKIDKYIEEQSSKLTKGLIDRRQFMMSVLATGVTLPIALSLADKAVAATPKKGGPLRWGNSAADATDTLDPATYQSSFMQATAWSYQNCLTVVDSDHTIVGELAESIESDDAQTWVYNLRKGVEFHNGKSMTAEDVVLNYQYHMNPDTASAAGGLLSQIETVSADGNDRVIFKLKGANADWPAITTDYHIMIKPTKDGVVDAQSTIGTGPYIMDEFNPGVGAKFGKRNPNYFKGDSVAHFDSVEVIGINDPATRQAALLNGEIDWMNGVDLRTANLLTRNPSVEITAASGYAHYTAPMRLNVPPFDNFDVRMAMKFAIKRQEIVDKIMLGYGTVGNDHPISTAHPYHNSALEQREFDADKAAYHWKKSGVSGPIEISTSEVPYAGCTDATNLIAASAQECGIDLRVKKEPEDGYWSNVWNTKGFSMSSWGGRPTEDMMWSAAFTDDTEWNEAAWGNLVQTDSTVRFNELVRSARSELDAEKRKSMYWEAQALCNYDGGAIVYAFNQYVGAGSKKLAHGEDVAGNWESDGNKLSERWWFA